MKKDCDAGPAFQNALSSESGISVQQAGIPDCGLTQISQKDANGILQVFFNPAESEIAIRSRQFLQDVPFHISDVYGRTITAGVLTGHDSRIHYPKITGGLYFLRAVGYPSVRFMHH